MSILSFVQSLANELKCQYSLGEVLSLQNRNQYFIPDGIIYYGEMPFVIVEEKNPNNKKQYEKTSHNLARIQDYMGIQWSILLVDDAIYLRPLYGDFENYGDIIETARIISSDKADTVPPLSKEEYLEVIKQQISKYMDRIYRKESISLFLEGLQANDFEIEKDGIYFSDTKETEFFMSLLCPVENIELWRYTTKNSLFLMLRDHNQNMLSLNCMNDISEIDYADKYIDTETCVLKKYR